MLNVKAAAVGAIILGILCLCGIAIACTRDCMETGGEKSTMHFNKGFRQNLPNTR